MFNDIYKRKNDIYGTAGDGGDITAEQFYTFLQSMLVAGTNITLVKNGTNHTITINSSTNSQEVINIVTNLFAAGTGISFRVEDDIIFIDATGVDDHKVLASETDTTPAELVHKVIGDGITVELVSTPDLTYGEQLKLKAIPEGIIKEAELGLQPIQLTSISDSMYFDGAAPIYKHMFFMNYSTRINTISLYCFQSGSIPNGLRFMFADENRQVIASTYKLTYVPQGWLELPLYGALEWQGQIDVSFTKKEKYYFCVGMQAGAQDPKWLGIINDNITGNSGEEIICADLNGYGGHTDCPNIVGNTLAIGSRSAQAGKRIWFAGYMN